MVFSFFKKKDAESQKPIAAPTTQGVSPIPPANPAMAVPRWVDSAAKPSNPVKPAPAPAASNPVTDLFTEDYALHELAPAEMSVLEETAILHANEQDDAARELLQDIVMSDTPCDEELWFMLFEVYQFGNDKVAFEELALKYVVAFERSAPIWQTGGVAQVEAAPKAAGPLVMMPAKIVGEVGAQVGGQVLSAPQKGTSLRIDCSRIAEVDARSAEQVFLAISGVRKQKNHIQFVKPEVLLSVLQNKIEVMRPNEDEAAFWWLLLEIMQWQGNQDEFEIWAVDYAVTYEVSPPSWEVLPKAPGTPKAVVSKQAEIQAAMRDAFVLPAVIDMENDQLLDKLMDYASEHPQVLIDCQQLNRMDFVSGGRLLNLLVQMQQQGKVVLMLHVGHLVGALFRVLGIHEFAKISHRK